MDDQHQFETAISLRDAGHAEEAEALLLRLLLTQSNSAALHAVLGDIYWDAGDYEKAIARFQNAVRLAPSSETASLGLFHCLLESGEKHSAFVEATRFLKMCNSEAYREILDEIEMTEGRHGP